MTDEEGKRNVRLKKSSEDSGKEENGMEGGEKKILAERLK